MLLQFIGSASGDVMLHPSAYVLASKWEMVERMYV